MISRYFAAMLIGGSALSLGGCDFVYGVRRYAKLEIQPMRDCVYDVIKATPGVTEVQYTATHEGKGLFHPTPWIYTYLYRGKPESHIMGALQIYKEYDGELTYHNTLLYMNRKPPQADVAASRPVMRMIETELANQCGVTGLPVNVKETCTGISCGPL